MRTTKIKRCISSIYGNDTYITTRRKARKRNPDSRCGEVIRRFPDGTVVVGMK